MGSELVEAFYVVKLFVKIPKLVIQNVNVFIPEMYKLSVQFKIKYLSKSFGSGGIRTHASEETGA